MSAETFPSLPSQTTNLDPSEQLPGVVDTGALSPMAYSPDGSAIGELPQVDEAPDSQYRPRHAAADMSPSQESIGDIVTVDNYNRGHRRDGKFLSTYEMNQIDEHADLIRDNLTDRAEARDQLSETETVQINPEAAELSPIASPTHEVSSSPEDGNPDMVTVETAEQIVRDELKQFEVEGDMPAIVANETNPSKLSKIREFFGRRKDQLKRAADKANNILQIIYSEEVEGVQLTASQAIRARLHPSQLKHNALANTARLFGRQHDYDRITDNAVKRGIFYDKAIAGDEAAYQYLRTYDKNYGKREMSLGEAVGEIATIFSGVAAVRKVGRLAMAGVTIAQLHREKDPAEEPKLVGKLEKIIDKERYSIGIVKYEREKGAYEALALRHPHRRDPFRHIEETRRMASRGRAKIR